MLTLEYVIVRLPKMYGAFFGLVVLLGFFALPVRMRNLAGRWLDRRYDHVFVGVAIVLTAIALAYLAYPGYFDHVEATIASLGLVLHRGDALYPTPEVYPYHGTLYGPALAELLALLFAMGVPTVVGSKLPGIAAFVATVCVLFRVLRTATSRGYLLYLVPFGALLFWTRAEPILLLFVAVTLLAGDGARRPHVSALLGLLAGAASAVKLHAGVYVLAAYIAALSGAGISLAPLALFAGAWVLAFLAPFAPTNVSLTAFIDYLRLAREHGLSTRLWFENLGYVFFLTIPVLVSWRGASPSLRLKLTLAFVVAAELALSVLGAKPGAGTHHLLPFVPINAYLLDRLCSARETPHHSVRVLYGSLLVPSVAVVYLTAATFARGWNEHAEVATELGYLQRTYPALVMGVSDDKRYSYAALRVLLDGEQIDYPAFMDLEYAGVPDKALAAKLRACEFTSIVVPRAGEPFSVGNLYDGKPLFSPAVRDAFRERYELHQSTKRLAVYRCADRG